MPDGFILSQGAADRVKELIQDFTRQRPDLTSYAGSHHVTWVQAGTLDETSGFYHCTPVQYQTSDHTWVSFDASWCAGPNNEALTNARYYLGVQFANLPADG